MRKNGPRARRFNRRLVREADQSAAVCSQSAENQLQKGERSLVPQGRPMSADSSRGHALLTHFFRIFSCVKTLVLKLNIKFKQIFKHLVCKMCI